MQMLQMLDTGPVQLFRDVAANQGHILQACLRSRKQTFMSRSLMRQAARPCWRGKLIPAKCFLGAAAMSATCLPFICSAQPQERNILVFTHLSSSTSTSAGAMLNLPDNYTHPTV